MLGQSITKNGILLALFAAVTTSAIAGTYLFTKDRIAEQERKAANKALLEIFPANTHDNELLNDVIQLDDAPLLGLTQQDTPHSVYVARKQNKPVGYIFPVIAPDGYSDKIKLLVGIKHNGRIAGVRVVQHRETPGLGDAIELKKSDWILGFNNKSLSNPAPAQWKVKKDKGVFDQFTGATITPRSITKAVYNSLKHFEQHHTQPQSPQEN
ncbi:MAG: electron transport complex subunit RsxG [Pseudomonadota bacterium]